jgi:hypothetical protein
MSALLVAWQAALAAEHQAVFGYSLLGAQLRGTALLSLAVTCSDAHEHVRDTTTQSLVAAGQRPAAAAADYPALYPVPDAAAAGLLAVRLEENCAASWRYLYAIAATVGSPEDSRVGAGLRAATVRTSAQDWLTAGAVRAVRWRRLVTPTSATVAFPGL